MSKKSDQFEEDIVSQIKIGDSLPSTLPRWMLDLGFVEGAQVTDSLRCGATGGKADVRVEFNKGTPLLISAKLANADYYGNWYSHNRVVKEFGDDVFQKITDHCTDWANNTWVKSDNSSLFVGVSLCFGKRTGRTGIDFSSFFGEEGIRKIVEGDGFNKANALLISDKVPGDLKELLKALVPINSNTIMSLSKDFKVIYRPINPMTEGTNRGKCIYTKFKPHQKLEEKTRVDSLNKLMKLGEFVTVSQNSLNHNRLLDTLETYNIFIPRKA